MRVISKKQGMVLQNIGQVIGMKKLGNAIGKTSPDVLRFVSEKCLRIGPGATK